MTYVNKGSIYQKIIEGDHHLSLNILSEEPSLATLNIFQKMKKIFLATALIFSILSSSAFAKTEGFYLGADFIGTKSTYISSTYYVGDEETSVKQIPSNKHTSYGFGFNSKYAFNFNNFFIAPGVFLEQNSVGGAKNIHRDPNNIFNVIDSLQVRNRYGVKMDFGYDIGRVAPYLTIGYSGISYKTRTNGQDSDNKLFTKDRKGRASNIFYGAGIKYSATRNVDLSVEYNYQKFTAGTKVPDQSTDYISRINFISRLDIVKVGLSYKF